MRIGLYVNAFEHGGAERVVSRLSSILQQQGHAVFVIISDASLVSYSVSGKLIDFQIPSARGLLGKLVTLLKRRNKLGKTKHEHHLDCVISFMDGANIVNILAKTKQTKTIVSIRNHLSSELKAASFGSVQKWIFTTMYKHADSVICVSKLIARDVEQSFCVPLEKIRVLYNPYDAESIRKDASLVESVDPKIADFIRGKEFCFVSMGRLSYQKGLWHLLKAFSLVKPSENHLGLVLIGDGEQGSKLKELASLLHIENSVCFCGYRENPYAIMALCSVYVLPSLFEGFPNALVEAMCLGLPVIAADCKSGPREILAPELDIYGTPMEKAYAAQYGYLFPPFSGREDWTVNCGEERTWADALESICIKTNEFAHYSKISVDRSKYFSEESCYSTLYPILLEG
ncbi:glycosyltransferase [Sphaerochaeta pleomorpha str. Grapes]|uniref:Glycosyltransferase n=1 Tax=Sphaerochaeta pleomorpha (strain ATCC BAA-1885 / DSM 22778 / Grapes) TaxID=158190 RepID=G8QW89_SPHPG|nr:glycosyltransferase [Sphaerochaeta pleomorpha]AEV29387.1 glycosyltransferase [Sphaerochaeta pleomorpha str. Grapes]